MAAEKYQATPDIQRFPISASEEIVYAPLTRQTYKLDPVGAQLLQACSGQSQSLDDHTNRICREMGVHPSQAAAVRAKLGELVYQKLMITEQDLVQKLQSKIATQAPPAKITTVGIPTRDRPEFLSRCLESYSRAAETHSRKMRFVVSDQSDDSDMRQRNIDEIAKLKQKFDLDYVYIGADEKEKMAQELANQASIPIDLVRYALIKDPAFPRDVGASRNALLLASAGELLLSVDDDTMCRARKCTDSLERLTLTSAIDTSEFWFLQEGEELSLESDFDDADVFALHEHLLGKRLNECVSEHANEQIHFTSISAPFFRKIDHADKVIVTQLGVAGDSGLGSPNSFLNLPDASRARLMTSEKHYRYVLANHQIVRSVVNPTVSDGNMCIGMNMGLDNRELMPPFIPPQTAPQNEDGIFASLVRATSLGYFGYMPWSLYHRRQTRKPYPDPLTQAGKTISTFVVPMLIEQCAPMPHSRDARRNLSLIADRLIEWGTIERDQLREGIRLMLSRVTSMGIASLDAALRKHNRTPEYWAKDVDAIIKAIKDASIKPNYVVCSDLAKLFGEECEAEILQKMILDYGKLIRAWPDIHATAKRLRSEGWQPGRSFD